MGIPALYSEAIRAISFRRARYCIEAGMVRIKLDYRIHVIGVKTVCCCFVNHMWS